MGKGACVESCSDGPRAICRILQAILAGLLLFIGITCQFWAGLNVNDVPLSKLCNTYSGSPEVMTTDDFNQLADWFENQVIDKGWNAGFNKFYPEVKSVGYSGQFPSQNYLCSFPTSCEKFKSPRTCFNTCKNTKR